MSTSTSLTTAQLQALITGIPIHCATTVFSVAGQTLTASQAVTLLSSVLATQTAATAARASLTEAVTARAQTALGDGVVARALRDAIGLQFSSSVSILSSFAITPRKPPKPLSGAARAAATAKAEATRKARGTASKKQKHLGGNEVPESSGDSRVVLRAVA
jgi:hypothetical protein